jgi:hypothetical protein
MKRTSRFQVAQVVAAVVAVCLAAILVGCQATRQTRGAEPAGFLRDYSMLKPGKGDDPQLVYINPNANWKAYDSVMIDSVTIWYTDSTEKLSAEDRQTLTSLLYNSLHTELGKDYTIVNYPGPRTLRVRAAITETKGASVVGNTVTTIVPQLKLASTLAGVATDTQVWVGKAGAEIAISDSMTAQRLAAAVDERAGAKSFQGIGGKWTDVENAFKAWAVEVREKLAELRAGA